MLSRVAVQSETVGDLIMFKKQVSAGSSGSSQDMEKQQDFTQLPGKALIWECYVSTLFSEDPSGTGGKEAQVMEKHERKQKETGQQATAVDQWRELLVPQTELMAVEIERPELVHDRF